MAPNRQVYSATTQGQRIVSISYDAPGFDHAKIAIVMTPVRFPTVQQYVDYAKKIITDELKIDNIRFGGYSLANGDDVTVITDTDPTST